MYILTRAISIFNRRARSSYIQSAISTANANASRDIIANIFARWNAIRNGLTCRQTESPVWKAWKRVRHGAACHGSSRCTDVCVDISRIFGNDASVIVCHATKQRQRISRLLLDHPWLVERLFVFASWTAFLSRESQFYFLLIVYFYVQTIF